MKTREYTAAGGVVLDDRGRVLMITRTVQRSGALTLEVRLPKGHVEMGETDEQAALREVCEETGYCGLAILADLGTALTEFRLGAEFVRRTEHYYLMRLVDPHAGAPHFPDPEAEEARFRPYWAPNLAGAQNALTFPTEREFVDRARELLENAPE
jgi:8-oxo-dGTP pyrophosphatase MutT (NUDIX family)